MFLWLLLILVALPTGADESLCLERLAKGGPFASLAGELAAGVAEGEFSESGGRRLLALARDHGDLAAEACAYEQLGNAAFYRDDAEGAERAFVAALERLVILGDVAGQAYRLKDIGICQRTQGRFAEALQTFEQARERYPAVIQGPFAVSFLGNLGSLYARLGSPRLAADAFREALGHTEADPTQATAAWDLRMRLALLLLEAGAAHHAVDHLEKAAEHVEEYGTDRDISWVLGELSWAYEQVRRPADARRVLERSLAAARRSGDDLHVVGALIDFGDLLLRIGKTPDEFLEIAEQSYREAIGTDPSQPLAWRAYAGLGKVRRRQGELRQAMTFLETSLELSEHRRRALSSWQDRSRLAAWNRPVYGALAALLIETGENERAFEVAELGKARDLAAFFDATDVTGASPRQEAIEARLAALVAEIQEDSAKAGDRLLWDLEAAEAELDEILDASRSSGNDAPLPLSEVQRLLPQKTALLSYLSSEDDVTVFVVRRDALVARRLEIGGDALELVVDVYLEQLIASRHWVPASRRLYRELVEPVIGALDGIEDVVIAADGPLRSLPFSTLVTAGDGTNVEDFLLSRMTLSMVPSARVLGDLRSRQPTAGADLLAIADPVVDKGFALHRRQADLYGLESLVALPASQQEAETAGSFAESAVILLGEDATEARLGLKDLQRFRVLHVASHALVDAKMPRRSALALTPTMEDDGFLQAREIARLEACPELVVLAACHSGREQAPPSRGPGVHGLALSFFHAGARSVVATLWGVDDAVSQTLTASFYEELASGKSKAGALRAAKLQAFERYGAEAPRHWAPWILLGEPFGEIPLRGPADRKLALFLFIPGLLCAALSVALWRTTSV